MSLSKAYEGPEKNSKFARHGHLAVMPLRVDWSGCSTDFLSNLATLRNPKCLYKLEYHRLPSSSGSGTFWSVNLAGLSPDLQQEAHTLRLALGFSKQATGLLQSLLQSLQLTLY